MGDTLGRMDPIDSPAAIQNIDIVDLVNRLDVYMLEISAASSATRHETTVHDVNRVEAMVTRFETRFNLLAGQPELDFPKTHPKAWTVPAAPDLPILENQDSQTIINLLATMRQEIAGSDSAERTTGLKPADRGRIEAAIVKLKILVDAIAQDPSLDLPDVDRQEPA